MKPLGIYLHIPFCRRKCAYCDFLSEASVSPKVIETLNIRDGSASPRAGETLNIRDGSASPRAGETSGDLQSRYVEALGEEIFARAGGSASPRAGETGADLRSRYIEALCEEVDVRSGGEQADTVFFGGGTPSMLSPREISRIIAAIRGAFKLSSGAEITMEANPDTVTPESLSGYREAGVNRISFGVQSLQDHLLAELGRIHSADRARLAVRQARDAGFDNIGVDLMFGLPGQTVADWRGDVREALSLGISHLSAYELTLEKGTPMGDNPPPLPDEDEVVAMWEAVAVETARAGFARYEVSNYARPGRECRHNLKYWRDEDFFGFGAGAWSSLGGIRTGNARTIAGYLAEDGFRPAETDQPDARKKMAETLMLNLRTTEGCLESGFLARYGEHALEGFSGAVAPHLAEGRLERVAGSLRLTSKGFMLANEIWADILAI